MRYPANPTYDFYVYAELYPYFQKIRESPHSDGFKTESEANNFAIECEKYERKFPYPECSGRCVCDDPEAQEFEQHTKQKELLISEWRENHPAYRDGFNDPGATYDRYFVTTMTTCPCCNNDSQNLSNVCGLCEGIGFVPLAPINPDDGETFQTARGLLHDIQMSNLGAY